MSSNLKPLIALGLTAAGTALVANFQVPEPTPVLAAVPAASAAPAKTTAPTTSTSTSSTTGTAATSTKTTTPTATATPEPSTATSSSAATTATAAYADGTYSGSAIHEPWGTFEVQVTISGGQITAVNLVSSPNDRHSSSINSFAVPQLTQEALAVQTSDIDWVSGATWTSQSYTASLQSALDDAAAARAQVGG